MRSILAVICDASEGFTKCNNRFPDVICDLIEHDQSLIYGAVSMKNKING